MKLTDLAKKIISEDTWGNNPASGGGMSPGRSPTAVPPPASSNTKIVDISNSYKNFKNGLENQETAAVKKFSEELKKQFLKKHVSVNASKGSVGQIQKEYGITVNNIEARYMKDKYYVVFIGKEGNESDDNEYYLEDSSIQVSDSAPTASDTGTTGELSATPQTSSGNTKRNILPQK